jgi:acyl-CoA synthetase (AMP-forming)/AMP-acid ligase II
MVSHANVAFTAAAIQRRLDYRADDVVGLYLPLSFDYGLYQLFLALDARASVYLGSLELVPLQLCDMLGAERISVLPATPLLLTSLVRMLDRTPRALPRLRAVTNTGEPLPPATVDALREHVPGLDVFLMYGLTECKRVSILLPEEIDAHPGSVGRPIDGTSALVVDADGSPVPDGTLGELIVAGPHVTLGYWRAPDETAQRFGVASDGTRTLRTGDLCWRSGDGYLYVEGRRDAQVKHRGFRISLLEIESAATDASGTACAAVMAPEHCDQLHLYLVGGDPELSADAVARALRARLEPYKVPDHIHIVGSLPTTAHGKVDRDRLRTFAAGSRS